MNWNALPRPVVLVPRVAWQRWALIAAAVAAVLGASTSTALAAGHQNGVVLALIVALAVVAVIYPYTNAGLVTEAVVVLQWLAAVDHTTTPWTMCVASCLFVFHVVVALTALTPVTAALDGAILRRWARRSGVIVLATIGVWGIVVAMAARRAPGSAALTVIAFVTLTGLLLLARAHGAASSADQAP